MENSENNLSQYLIMSSKKKKKKKKKKKNEWWKKKWMVDKNEWLLKKECSRIFSNVLEYSRIMKN
jgi:hypothetical protein